MLFICSCSSVNDNIFNVKAKISKLPDTIELTGQMVDIGSYDVLNISDIQIFDSILVIKGSVLSSEYFFHTFSIPQKTYCGSFVTKGRGAKEMLDPTMRGYIKNKQNEILVNMMEVNLKTAYNWNLSQSILKGQTELAQSYVLEKLTFDLYPKDLDYVAIHPKGNDLYCSSIDATKQYEDIASLYPGVSVMDNIDKLSSPTVFNGKTNQLVMSMMMLPQINFLDVNTKEKKTTAVSREFKNWKNILQKDNKDLTIYYIDCTQSDDFFIALYANATFENWSNGMYEPHLHFCDWEGNVIYDFKIGQTLKAIAYDKLHNTLYGVDVNDDLYSYNFGAIN